MILPIYFPDGPLAVLVTGGRDYSDAETVAAALGQLDVQVLIHGGARGADTLAREWARDMLIPAVVYEADWHRHGRRAGPLRNEAMVAGAPHIAREYGATAVVVAFPGGRGTWDCTRRAREHGLPVWQVTP